MNAYEMTKLVNGQNNEIMRLAKAAGNKSCTIKRLVADDEGKLIAIDMEMYFYNCKWNRKPYEEALKAAMGY